MRWGLWQFGFLIGISFLVFANYLAAQPEPEGGQNILMNDTDWQKGLEELKTSMDRLLRDNELLRVENKSLQKKQEQLRTNLNQYLSEQQKLSGEPNRLKTLLDQKSQQEIDLDVRLRDSVAQLNNLKKDLEASQQKLTEQQKNTKTLKEEIHQYQDEVGGLENQVQQAKGKNQRELTDLRNDVKRYRLLLEEGKNEESRTTKELADMRTRLEERESQVNELKAQQKQLEEQLNDIKNQVESNLAQKVQMDTKPPQGQDDDSRQSQEIDSELKVLRDKHQRLSAELTSLKAETQSILAQKKDRQEQKLKGDLAILREENQYLQQEMNSISSVIEDFKKEKMLVETLFESYDAK